jgi:hypothetical protein
VKSGQNALITQHSLVGQKWLIEDENRKKDSVGGIGPFGLVKNKQYYAAYTRPRVIPVDFKSAKGEEYKKGDEQQGVVIFAGGHYHHTLLQNWLGQDTLDAQIKGNRQAFRHTDLEIQ